MCEPFSLRKKKGMNKTRWTRHASASGSKDTLGASKYKALTLTTPATTRLLYKRRARRVLKHFPHAFTCLSAAFKVADSTDL